MLASITPLGERGRSSHWGVTVAFFVAGSTLAGAALGALAGELGRLTWPGTSASGTAQVAVVAAALALGLVFDLAPGGLRLPTVRRQVNEAWLGEYRGWVYGLGFGLQLGVGVSTIVTTSAVYVALIAAWVVADPVLGAVVAGTFGLIRGATLLAAASATDAAHLIALHSRIDAWREPGRRLALSLQAALLVLAITAIVV